MIAPISALQTSMGLLNNAQMSMVRNSDRMLGAIAFGNSQPLNPAFAQNCDCFEMQNKVNETKVTVLQKLIEAMEKRLGKDIKRTVPKYSGLDYKA